MGNKEHEQRIKREKWLWNAPPAMESMGRSIDYLYGEIALLRVMRNNNGHSIVKAAFSRIYMMRKKYEHVFAYLRIGKGVPALTSQYRLLGVNRKKGQVEIK